MGNRASQSCKCSSKKYHTTTKSIIYCNIEDKLLYLACDKKNKRQILAQETFETSVLKDDAPERKENVDITYIITFISAGKWGGHYVLVLVDDKDNGALSLIWSPHNSFDALMELKPVWFVSYGLVTQTGKLWSRGNEAMIKHAREWILPAITVSLRCHLPSVLCDIVLSYCSIELVKETF